MKASQLRKGLVVSINGAPYRVRDIDVSTPTARGGNTMYRVKFTSIANGQNLDQSFKSNDNLDELILDHRPINFLYSDPDAYHFMDAENFEQYSLSADQVEDQKDWLVENMEGLFALLLDGQVVSIELPSAVDLEIVETAPMIKGATATSRNKPATLSNGRVVLVPEYLASGERVRVNTETCKFMSRSK
ncbi:MAG: elongation factor P-like protein YeiP [Proteobacteria bacterium]|nr:elongation factor P-like protein YeiP [Pseudomonadota bacterium]